MILIAAVVAVAVGTAQSALAGFNRLTVAMFDKVDGLAVLSCRVLPECDASFADARPYDVGSSAAEDSGHESRLPIVLRELTIPLLWNLASPESSAKPVGGPSTGPSGSSNAAIVGSIPWMPEDSLIGIRPDEMGPFFCNPPPWAPLRPPRT